ncbi:MAG: carboxymuconolactone decarboxylase family protein [Actinobacteria bacterium]|nr:carboxymuconolactone decarboxylase family protein [Actinomycetota bacterium]MCL6086964.1 carboxymuconolactone decarboxylase family protein [Actinomycetota bacterium]
MDEKTKELIAVGAAVAGNCIPCLEWHYKKCVELRILRDEIKEAIELANIVKNVPIKKINELAQTLLSSQD